MTHAVKTVENLLHGVEINVYNCIQFKQYTVCATSESRD